MSDEELLETYRASVNKAMDEASARDGFATNMSRESIVAGLRAVFDMSKGEKRAEWEAEQGDYYEGFEEGVKVGRDGLGPRPITDEMLGIMAQAFFEATGAPGSGIRYTRMTVKPEIVAGLRAALEAAEEARR